MRIPAHSTPPAINTLVSERKPAAERAESTEPGAASARPIESASTRAAAAGVKLGEDITSRLTEVRRLIADGSYPIDFDRLAEKILDDETARAAGSRS